MKRTTMLQRKRTMATCVVAGFIWVFSCQANEAIAVTFPDPSLESLVRNELKINYPNEITVADMQTIIDLNPNHYGITGISNLQGLEYATNLTGLWMHGQPFGNISPLSNLTNLEILDLGGISVSDFSPLSGLVNLKDLNLWGSSISDLSPLSGLANLENLALCDTPVSDLSPLSGLPNLKVIVLDFLAIDVCQNLRLPNLQNIQMSNAEIDTLSLTAELGNLEIIDLYGSQIEVLDLSGTDLTSLNSLCVDFTTIKKVVLADTVLNSDAYLRLMYNYSRLGITELDGVVALDMSGVDFINVGGLGIGQKMDDLEVLSLNGASNLAGSMVVSDVNALDSLNWLDVTGLWDTFDTESQNALLDWGAIENHTLITSVPEPTTISMLIVLASLVILLRKRQ